VGNLGRRCRSELWWNVRLHHLQNKENRHQRGTLMPLLRLKLRGHVGFVQGERVGLFDRGSRRRNLFTMSGAQFPRGASKSRTSVITGHRVPERSKRRAEPVQRSLSVGGCWPRDRWETELDPSQKGGTYDAMSGDCAVIADTLKEVIRWIQPRWQVFIKEE
jgi:hypothetical protein